MAQDALVPPAAMPAEVLPAPLTAVPTQALVATTAPAASAGEGQPRHEARRSLPAGTPEGREDIEMHADEPIEQQPSAMPTFLNGGGAIEAPTEMRPAPESKRRRTIGGLPVNISSLLVAVCAVYGALSGELLDPALVETGRQKERDQMSKSEVYRRVPLHSAKGKRVKSKWVEDYKVVGGSRIVRSRLVAMEFAWDTRYDTSCRHPTAESSSVGFGLGSCPRRAQRLEEDGGGAPRRLGGLLSRDDGSGHPCDSTEG